MEIPLHTLIVEVRSKTSNIYIMTVESWMNWYSLNFRVAPTLALRGLRLFGMEKEPPNDLHNIFYRCVRYCVYSNRKKSVLPSLKYFVTLVRDELKTKYLGLRFQKYASCPLEAAAVHWLRTEMGWTQTIPERIPR